MYLFLLLKQIPNLVRHWYPRVLHTYGGVGDVCSPKLYLKPLPVLLKCRLIKCQRALITGTAPCEDDHNVHIKQPITELYVSGQVWNRPSCQTVYNYTYKQPSVLLLQQIEAVTAKLFCQHGAERAERGSWGAEQWPGPLKKSLLLNFGEEINGFLAQLCQGGKINCSRYSVRYSAIS